MRDATNEVQQNENEIGKKVHHAVMALDLISELKLPEKREHKGALCQGSRIPKCFWPDFSHLTKAGTI